VTGTELHLFYENLVGELRERGVVCGITSGLACVHYGIAESTKDCDLLCHPGSFGELLSLLSQTPISGVPCAYRGNISPPLDARWHRGGWTSHFEWATHPRGTTLDVFGFAVRQSSPWQQDLEGLYVSRNVVAEMKRTDREKDWPFINSLGVEMLHARDARGWLHLFDADDLLEMLDQASIPSELIKLRPVLALAQSREPNLRQALLAERQFWQELDRLRTRIYRAALRPYVHAVGRARIAPNASLDEQHDGRLACAQRTLSQNPVRDHGLERFIEEARDSTAALVRPELLQWLPNVRPHVTYLEA
jgi:hypothetical protein